MKQKVTDIKRSPQVFLREIQLENDSKKLMNYHRLFHAWMAELRSASPTTEIGENGWTPRYIVPAHDRVVERLKQLIPGFNHDENKPIQTAAMPPLLPITIKENAVRVVSAGAGRQFGITLDKDGDWAQMLAAAFGQSELRIFAGDKVPDGADLDIPAYHLVLMPVDEWTAEGASADVARQAYDKLMGATTNSPRGIQGRMFLRASILPGMGRDELYRAAGKAAQWVASGDPLPRHVLGGAILPGAVAQDLAAEGVRLFKRLVVPITDENIVDEAAERIRARAVDLVKEFDGDGQREHELREFVRQLAEELKS